MLKKSLVSILFVLSLFSSPFFILGQDEDSGNTLFVRFLHASPDTGPLTGFLNDTLLFSNLTFGYISNYTVIEQGLYQLYLSLASEISQGTMMMNETSMNITSLSSNFIFKQVELLSNYETNEFTLILLGLSSQHGQNAESLMQSSNYTSTNISNMSANSQSLALQLAILNDNNTEPADVSSIRIRLVNALLPQIAVLVLFDGKPLSYYTKDNNLNNDIIFPVDAFATPPYLYNPALYTTINVTSFSQIQVFDASSYNSSSSSNTPLLQLGNITLTPDNVISLFLIGEIPSLVNSSLLYQNATIVELIDEPMENLNPNMFFLLGSVSEIPANISMDEQQRCTNISNSLMMSNQSSSINNTNCNGYCLFMCADQCYSGTTHVCTTLNLVCPWTHPFSCGAQCYTDTEYNCIDATAGLMCPAAAPLRCGDACYNAKEYSCIQNELAPASSASPVPSPVSS